MSAMNILPIQTMDPYMEVEQPFAQPFSMDMLEELQWPCTLLVSPPAASQSLAASNPDPTVL